MLFDHSRDDGGILTFQSLLHRDPSKEDINTRSSIDRSALRNLGIVEKLFISQKASK